MRAEELRTGAEGTWCMAMISGDISYCFDIMEGTHMFFVKHELSETMCTVHGDAAGREKLKYKRSSAEASK